MIYDFTYCNPTKIYFGKTALTHLPSELALYGKNILLIYGKNSIKKYGIYDQIISALHQTGKTVVELAGINSNPRYSQVLQGGQLVRENHTDLILAVGGGSVIDCAKGIAASAYYQGDAWQHYWVEQGPIVNPIVPVASVLTMTGTASEMNTGSVITHEEKKLKLGRVFPFPDMTPKFSILNPEFTFTVPHLQMVSGIADIFSHLMEQYFGGTDDCTSDYLLEGVMLSLINASRKAVKNPQDYEARSNIMWCATMGLNKILALSKQQDWEVHMIEHQLGAYTDCPHGIGLAIISPAYYRYIYQHGLPKFVRFAKNIWHIPADGLNDGQIALEGIACLQSFFKELGIPQHLRDIGATEDMLPEIARSTIEGGGYYHMKSDDILQVLKNCF
ncbi:MAG: iron-containing alcohol dehydrogenase [Bacteroidales bacterium]|nr:iron-containing alcohol dehydrogenase [Bacteroidales bacterium]